MTEKDKTGMMYVVWHRDSETRSLEDGVQRIKDWLIGTGAEYTSNVDNLSRIVRDTAIEHFDDQEFNPLRGAKPRSEKYRQAVQEFGQRAVYEVCIRYVGQVDARGKLVETKPKRKRK